MALDRQSIEKKDFPVGQRGYDPDAVDAHLSAVAQEFDAFKQSARRRADTLASSASEQVRAIVEAAEASANEIQRHAEDDAKDIRDEASSEAAAIRESAAQQAREYVSKVSDATSAMMTRLESIESELASLMDALRSGSSRLNADLQQLDANLGDIAAAVSPRPRFEPETASVAGDSAYDAESSWGSDESGNGHGDRADGGEPAGEAAQHEGVVDEPEYTYDPDNPPADEGEDTEGDDTEGARLIALNMALNGTPREETERYLSENFQLSDAGGLLDEVYASVEG